MSRLQVEKVVDFVRNYDGSLSDVMLANEELSHLADLIYSGIENEAKSKLSTPETINEFIKTEVRLSFMAICREFLYEKAQENRRKKEALEILNRI